jgi:hypothetical protein
VAFCSKGRDITRRRAALVPKHPERINQNPDG